MMVKNAFEDPKNCQNNEHELNYKTVGIQFVFINLLTISMIPPISAIDHRKMPTRTSSDVGLVVLYLSKKATIT